MAAQNLGSFGKEKEQIEAVFDYFGETIRVNPSVSETSFVDLTEKGINVKEDDPSSVVIMKDFVRDCVHPEDFDRFWAAGKAHRQNPEDIMETCQALMEKVLERPTGRPAGSSGGRRKTRRKSKRSSSDPALRLLAGRPDLQEAVVMKREAQRAG